MCERRMWLEDGSVSHFTPIRLAYGLKYVLDYKCSEEEIETSKESYRPFP